MSRGFIIAVQFLTRLPTPSLQHFAAAELATSARWFPAVGLLVGGCVLAVALGGQLIDPWLGALLGLIAWIGVTGALHLDGLADLADAFGAAHRDPARFLEVLRDPHLGAFGAIALIVAIVAKLVLVQLAIVHTQAFVAGCLLVPAWARFGALAWSWRIAPISSGAGERFAWGVSKTTVVVWLVALVAASVAFVPALLCAPLLIWLWERYLQAGVGGLTGDCLGAGIEIVELALLLAMLLFDSVVTT